MNLIRAYGKIKKEAKLKRAIAFLAVLAMIVGLMQPTSVVKAADDTEKQLEKIESFKATLEKGAENIDGKYVWNAKTDAEGHQFVYRVSYHLSGVKTLAPGNIKIRIPKTILKDRKGKQADYADMSIPSDEEYKQSAEEDVSDVNYTWKDTEDGKYIEITNVTERNAGENGYIEVAYVTNGKTFKYKDMSASDPFKADITVTNGDQTVTASSDAIPVYINTGAEIRSTEKKMPSDVYREWQSSWGTQPEKTKGMCFLVWQIVSKIKKDPTQPYTFTLEDTPQSEELNLIGYSMGNEKGPFTDNNKVTGQKTDSDRYDYVLTYYDPAKFTGEDYYELKNSVVATVTPEDGIDAPTSANSSKQWEWDTPKFVHPTGSFYGKKYGDNNWHDGFGYYHDYSSYSLDQLQEKKKDSIDTFRYFCSVYGYGLPWTVDGDPDNPESYGKKNVTYQLTDDELYLNDKITSEDIGNNQLKYNIPKTAKQLDANDYQFLYADWSVKSEFAKFDSNKQKFVPNSDGIYSSKDVIHFWAKTKDSKDYTEVASYNIGTNSATIKDSSIVSALDGKRITFAENANVTGIRFTTSNAYYYTEINAYPMVKLKNSEYVMNTVKDKELVRLHNFSQNDVFDSDGNDIFTLRCYAFDRAVKPKKESEIHKHIVSTGSSRLKKTVTMRWKITQKETITTDEGTEYMVQDSGTFYDLLPSGMHFQKGSVEVETEKGSLSSSSYTVSVESNYRGSGREMIKVSIPIQAKHYDFYLSAVMDWDSIKDFGSKINNPVAYETGNDDIYKGYPDSGGTLSAVNKTYMTGLDAECTKNKFIYDEEPYEIAEITAAVSGLKKQVRDENDSRWLYETSTTPNGNYAYRLRFSNTTTDKAKNLIFFDSLENYNLNGKKSDWHGTLKSFDTSQLKQMGINPVVYVSSTENLSIDDHHDLKDTSVWQKLADNTDLSKVHAFAIDCTKNADGDDFVLNEGESITATVNMKAPANVTEIDSNYAKAYNNIYIQDTIMSKGTSSDYFIHQDYTELKYRIAAPVKIHKQSSNDESISIKGAEYRLTGTSDYGTEISQSVTTGYNGNAVFDNIEKGTYVLKEISSPDDWQLNHHEYSVKIDSSGKVTVDGESVSDYATVKDSPRIHGDISFMKYSTVSDKAVKGAKFRLSGTSKYGNDVMEYAESDENGKVKFSNIEYGTYKLKEVETPEGYIPSSDTYTAMISESGVCGIADAEMLNASSPVIRNEPYHSIQISKQSSYDGSVISGAEFSLSGVSDYGHSYDKTAVSGNNGIVKFDGLESGKYTLTETKAPEGYEASTAKHIVTLKKNGKYTITDLDKNDSGLYRVDNRKKENGKIIVKKTWEDDWANSQRPDPVIHLSTDISKMPTYAVWGKDAWIPNNEYIKYADVPESEVPSDAERMDKNYDDPDAVYKIYVWKKGNTTYYWTNAQTTKLTDGSGRIFGGDATVKSIDLSHVITDGMTNMGKMFYGDTSLTELDLSTFNTSNVTNMVAMFGQCENLKTVNLSSFDTSKVTNMSYMFLLCKAIEPLDLSHFNTPNLQATYFMFAGTEKLKDIYVSDRWNLDNVVGYNSVSMFAKSGIYSGGVISDQVDPTHLYTPGGYKPDWSKYDEWKDENGDKTHANYGTDGYLKYKAYEESSNTSKANDQTEKTDSGSTSDYVSTNKSHCSVTKDGNKWTYTFKVADENAKYYLWEDDMPDYEGAYSTYASKDSPGTVTNTAYSYSVPKTGSLSITKKLDGKQYIEKSEEKYSHTSNVDDTGKATEAYAQNQSTSDVVTIPGATKLHVKLYFATYWADMVCVWQGSHPDYTPLTNYDTSRLGDHDRTFSGRNISSGKELTKDNAALYEGDIEGDTVTFGFTSFEAPTRTFGYYAVVTGTGVDTGKTTEVPELYKNKTYIFDVTLKQWQEESLSDGKDDDGKWVPLKGTALYGNTVFTNGVGKVAVKAGETVTLNGIPSGTLYEIKEENSDSFYVQEENSSGTTTEKNTAVLFSNHYKKPSSETGNFTIEKKVEGHYQNAGRYRFDISFKGLTPETEYTLSSGKTFRSDASGNGYVDAYIGKDETLTVKDIPAGAEYKITEAGGDWSSAYSVSSDSGKVSQNADSAGNGKSLSTAWETAEKGETEKITYTNTVNKYQNLVLKKEVSGEQTSDRFEFEIKFSNLYETVASDAGTIVPDDDGTASVDAYLTAGNEIVFKNIPVNAKYSITEKANSGRASYTISGPGGKFVKSSDGNTVAMKDLSTATETVDEGENATVTFTNDMSNATDVTLKKQVLGAFADKTKFFKFTVSLVGADKKQSYSFDYTNGSDSHNGTKNAASITTDENGHGSTDIWLKHNDTVVIKNIPLSAKYSIAEDPGEYVPGITINGEKADSVSERSVAPDTIVFTNTNTAVLPTGITQHRNAIALASTAIIALLISAWYILKKRHKKESKAK